MDGWPFSVAEDLVISEVSKSLEGWFPLIDTIKYDSLKTLIGINCSVPFQPLKA